MRTFTFLTFTFYSLLASAQLPAVFNAADQPATPDYSLEKNWSALPFRKDAADVVPSFEKWIDDSLKQADVFFVYPTIHESGNTWNADLNNKKLNKKIDNKPIRYQASVFNASARVYAPRYRQSHIKAFYDSVQGPRSLAFAYEDVKKAFQYYLDHYNNGRPIIIASHSQGSYHTRRLLADFFDSTELRKKLVAAYVVGFGCNQNRYLNLKPCDNAEQTGCYVSWASYKKGFEPGETMLAGDVCVNPISWNRDTVAADASKSLGGILLNFNKKYLNNISAQTHKNILWVGSSVPLISTWDNLHIADYNLFWFDIRENVKRRIEAYQNRK